MTSHYITVTSFPDALKAWSGNPLSRAELAAYLILASLFGFCTVAAVMSAGGLL